MPVNRQQKVLSFAQVAAVPLFINQLSKHVRLIFSRRMDLTARLELISVNKCLTTGRMQIKRILKIYAYILFKCLLPLNVV